MTLEINKWYLTDHIQVSDNCFKTHLSAYKCIEETPKAYRLEDENGGKFWVMKTWKIHIIDSFIKN